MAQPSRPRGRPEPETDPTLFTAEGEALKKAWPVDETLFAAFVSAKHPYRSSFQSSLTKPGQAVLEQGETLQTLRLERQLGIPMSARSTAAAQTCSES